MDSPRNYNDTNENPEKNHKIKGRSNDLNDLNETYIVNKRSINHFVYHLSNAFSDFFKHANIFLKEIQDKINHNKKGKTFFSNIFKGEPLKMKHNKLIHICVKQEELVFNFLSFLDRYELNLNHVTLDEILTRKNKQQNIDNVSEELIYDLNSITNILQEMFVFIKNGYIEHQIQIHILTKFRDFGIEQNEIMESFDDFMKEFQNS